MIEYAHTVGSGWGEPRTCALSSYPDTGEAVRITEYEPSNREEKRLAHPTGRSCRAARE
jgi:hypothetical protein